MTEMTPKTQNATIENLRKLARLIEMGQPLHAEAVAESILLCASAWKADRARIEALEKELVYLAGEVAEGSDMVVEAATIWARLAAIEWVRAALAKEKPWPR